MDCRSTDLPVEYSNEKTSKSDTEHIKHTWLTANLLTARCVLPALMDDIERDRFHKVGKGIVSEAQDLLAVFHNREIMALGAADKLPGPRYNHKGLLGVAAVSFFPTIRLKILRYVSSSSK